MKRFSLYIHIPFCQAKCPYCDFNSYAVQQRPEGDYVTALISELRHYAARDPWRGGTVATIFFGGGTPSLFAAGSIARVLDETARHWAVASGVEATLEANPGTVTLATLRGLRTAGINRISFGVQSFEPHHLQRLGRIHGADDGAAAVDLARRAGFENVSLDLIFGLPAQTLSEWERDIARACALQPNHVSAYNLTIEEGTPFHDARLAGALEPLPEDLELAMFVRARDLFAVAGYQQYEISNYAQLGYACAHNLNYWRSGPYLGVGAGAHSFSGMAERAADGGRPLADGTGRCGRRWSNLKHPTEYLGAVARDGHARTTEEDLDERQAQGEFVFLALRCRDGVACEAFRRRFRTDLLTAFPHLRSLREDGLIVYADGRWQLSPRGLALADSVFATFL